MSVSPARAPRLTIFAMKGCTHCAAAKSMLSRAGIAFTQIDIHLLPQRYDAAVKHSGMQTVPVIYAGPFLVGGRSELEVLLDGAVAHEAAVSKLRMFVDTRYASLGEQASSIQPSPARSDDEPSADKNGDETELNATPEFLEPLSDVEQAKIDEAEREHATAHPSRLHEVQFVIPNTSSRRSFSDLVSVLRGPGGVEIRDRGLFWRKKKTFIAKDLVNVALRDICGAGTAVDDAVKFCTELHEHHMIRPFNHALHQFQNNDDLWRFVADHGSPSMNRVRVFQTAPEGDMSSPFPQRRNGADVAQDLRQWLGVILEKFVTDAGVAYHKMPDDDDFRRFVEATTELQTVDLDDLTRAEKIAFGINTYNMCVLHAYATRGPPSGYIDMYRFFNSIGYDIGGHHYTLNDLENGFLRGNRKAVGAFSLPFSEKDPRLAFVVENPDYRIHFALNCGAKSCPPIKIFTVDDLDKELQRAADAFMATNAELDAERRVLKVSKIIHWYKEDFTTPTVNAAGICVRHLPAALASDCRDVGVESLRLDYFDYDWSTNAAPIDDR